VKAVRGEGFTEPIQVACQGLGEEAFPDENGQRPAKLTVEKDKTDGTLQINLRNNAAYGLHTFVAYGTAQVEYAETAAGSGGSKEGAKGKKEKKKKRTTFASNPVTIDVAPPVSVEAREIAAVIPGGGSIHCPFEINRLEGVDGEVEATLQFPDGAKGFTAQAVKLKKGESTGEILLQSELDGELGKTSGFQLRTRVDFGGRSFEEKKTLLLNLERVPPLQVAAGEPGREICPGGSLLVPFKVDLAGGVGGKVSVGVKASKETRVEAERVDLPEGAREGKVKVSLMEGAAGELQGLQIE